ncbi:hypothetical protein L3Y34_007417 [Caenorhabditis briggsae]|nr:hypothetical protein L3Y34_007417 [Caenorhabditis briggsae]
MSVTSNLTISKSLFELTPDMELFYFGIIVFVFSIFNAPILALIITTLKMKNAQSPNMAFLLMNIINFCLLGQGLGHLITFPCLMFPNLLRTFETVVRIIGGIMNTLWICDLSTAKNLKSSVASRRNEIAILFQSSLVTGYISVMIFVWHPALFTTFQFIDMNDITNQAILNFMWLVHCYVNPCMLLVFNK